MTMIVGIVTEVAIFYFSEYEALLVTGMPTNDARLQAGVNRFRPIAMTTLAAILALLPLALGLGGNQVLLGSLQSLLGLSEERSHDFFAIKIHCFAFFPLNWLAPDHAVVGVENDFSAASPASFLRGYWNSRAVHQVESGGHILCSQVHRNSISVLEHCRTTKDLGPKVRGPAAQ